MQGQPFSRRRFFGSMAGVAGVSALVLAAAGCKGVQQALGPQSGASASKPSADSKPAAGSAPAAGGAPATTSGAASASQPAAGAAVTIRYMGHFTGLGGALPAGVTDVMCDAVGAPRRVF